MENRKICAVLFDNAYHNSVNGTMCPHCSSAKFNEDSTEPHWECKKYNIRLYDNEENYLVRCKECLIHGD